MNNNSGPNIDNDPELLISMLTDQKNANELYRAGPYWETKTKRSIKDIKKYGLNDFRSGNSTIGMSFTDSSIVDLRIQNNIGLRGCLSFLYKNIYPFNSLFDSQVRYTNTFFNSLTKQINYSILKDDDLLTILNNHSIPENNILGGCKTYCEIDGINVSHHYIQMIFDLSNISNSIELNNCFSYFEIGGGFGSFIHCLLENYDNIRKVIYLDIPPNLYVGTQYLKRFFGNSVKTYLDLKEQNEIRFQDNDDLEILCIAPWQIEILRCEIDMFHNAHSFVEMPEKVVKNYGKFVNQLLSKNGQISLVSYDDFDAAVTNDPSELPSLVGIGKASYKMEKKARALARDKFNYYFHGSL